MNAAATIRDARRRAGLTQAVLAQRAGTSQATLSAYESGRKQPSVVTLARVLEAAGLRLTTEMALQRNARIFQDALELAEALPSHRERRAPVSASPGVTFADRIVALHTALVEHRVPHAFGGAIALAYATVEPRGTTDIDVNVFLPADDAARALGALPAEVEQPAGTVERIARDGQIRLWWEGTAVDLFFDYAPIHADAARHSRRVPFGGTEITVLGPTELAIFKAMFDRLRDWGDLEEMHKSGTLDVEAVRKGLEAMLGPEDRRFERLDEVVSR